MEEASLLQPHLIECLLHSFNKTFGIIDNDSRFFWGHLCIDIVINGLPSLFGMGKRPSIRFFDKSRFDKFKPELENETLLTFRVEIVACKECPCCIKHRVYARLTASLEYPLSTGILQQRGFLLQERDPF